MNDVKLIESEVVEMKYYILNAVVNGKDVHLKRAWFSSRQQAIDYMFDYYEKHFMYSLQVSDEYQIDGNKHNIEYVCNNYNRFTINRVVA